METNTNMSPEPEYRITESPKNTSLQIVDSFFYNNTIPILLGVSSS